MSTGDLATAQCVSLCRVATTWLNTAEVAAMTRTPEATVRSWRRRRIGPAWCRVGRRALYDRADVDAFILAGRVETTGVVTAPGPERPSAGPSVPGGVS